MNGASYQNLNRHWLIDEEYWCQIISDHLLPFRYYQTRQYCFKLMMKVESLFCPKGCLMFKGLKIESQNYWIKDYSVLPQLSSTSAMEAIQLSISFQVSLKNLYLAHELEFIHLFLCRFHQKQKKLYLFTLQQMLPFFQEMFLLMVIYSINFLVMTQQILLLIYQISSVVTNEVSKTFLLRLYQLSF